ncbi:D-alanyl-D-alanine carboxypeptidase family protein [Aquabacterium sp. OR-4]|uniref:D-alanyl-D-alanine carboxypeptidase family protein n=1 Tax=Aquabacterium sp. OR-4 TaxID=2978127 RepID=UPI0021B2B7DE|nr:D-alanyl-D-alanine carboxypeptidase family protein [Aquabacterium sp. OR-4]MDT7834269.1 D-alanyl-D-alanine carboxypeptidase family protein [Aquabacterium sp. OR-4]
MKRFLVTLLACLGMACAQAQTPAPPEVAAKNWLLLDVTANQVLGERDADARVDPASLTKLMTAWLAFDAIKAKKLSPTQTLPVSLRAWAERKGGGSLMFIDTTMSPTVDELLRGMIIVSGNDAAVALAEGVGGSLEQFVAMMNRQAQAWGLKNTQFKNVTGLSEAGHHSSARDLATIASHIVRDFPEQYAAYYAQRNYSFNNIKQDNRNMLLGRDPTVDGMKTGYTDAAGYCLVASAQRDMTNGKRRLVSVVLGTVSREARAAESQKLLNWGWTAWDAVRLFEPGKAAASVPVWKGKAPTAALGAAQGVVVAVPKGEGDKLKTVVQRTDPLVAPLAKGQRVGTLEVSTAGGAKVASVPLVVMDSVPEAGIVGRAWDAIRLWIK